eukprot:scaffold12543_cov115-Isochrysis_galbana.AAC.1
MATTGPHGRFAGEMSVSKSTLQTSPSVLTKRMASLSAALLGHNGPRQARRLLLLCEPEPSFEAEGLVRPVSTSSNLMIAAGMCSSAAVAEGSHPAVNTGPASELHLSANASVARDQGESGMVVETNL